MYKIGILTDKPNIQHAFILAKRTVLPVIIVFMEIREAYKFCPRCGSGFENKPEFLKCTSCGLSFYHNPKPTTTVVLVDKDNRYLLVKRAVDPAKGYWDFPGGFVEENETSEENAWREIKEELGLDNLGKFHYVGSVTAPYLYQDIIYPTLATVFVTLIPPGARPRAADDIASFKFFKPEEIPMDKIAFPELKKVLGLVNKFLETHKL